MKNNKNIEDCYSYKNDVMDYSEIIMIAFIIITFLYITFMISFSAYMSLHKKPSNDLVYYKSMQYYNVTSNISDTIKYTISNEMNNCK